jgi:hypothetical protein
MYCVPPHQGLENIPLVLYRAIGDRIPPFVFPKDGNAGDSLLWNLLQCCWAIKPEERPTIDHLCIQFESNHQFVLMALEKVKRRCKDHRRANTWESG